MCAQCQARRLGPQPHTSPGPPADYWCAEPSGPSPSPDAPAILLVHGFGAFGDQWRGNVAALAASGYRVYAPTLPGFGRSEKAPVAYSQDGWRDFLRWVRGAGLVLVLPKSRVCAATCLMSCKGPWPLAA